MTIAFYEHPFSSYVQKAKSMSARDPGCVKTGSLHQMRTT